MRPTYWLMVRPSYSLMICCQSWTLEYLWEGSGRRFWFCDPDVEACSSNTFEINDTEENPAVIYWIQCIICQPLVCAWPRLAHAIFRHFLVIAKSLDDIFRHSWFSNSFIDCLFDIDERAVFFKSRTTALTFSRWISIYHWSKPWHLRYLCWTTQIFSCMNSKSEAGVLE